MSPALAQAKQFISKAARAVWARKWLVLLPAAGYYLLIPNGYFFASSNAFRDMTLKLDANPIYRSYPPPYSVKLEVGLTPYGQLGARKTYACELGARDIAGHLTSRTQRDTVIITTPHGSKLSVYVAGVGPKVTGDLTAQINIQFMRSPLVEATANLTTGSSNLPIGSFPVWTGETSDGDRVDLRAIRIAQSDYRDQK